MRRLFAIAVVAALAGCGNARTPPPETATPVDPQGETTYRPQGTGVSFTAPANWGKLEPANSLVGGVQSRTATVAVWRYPRDEPLPRDAAAMQAARDRLVERVQAADPSFALDKARVGRRAVTLTGKQTMAGVQVAIRSRHVFRHGAEVVVDAYARPEDFARVDGAVFQPVLRSLRVRKP